MNRRIHSGWGFAPAVAAVVGVFLAGCSSAGPTGATDDAELPPPATLPGSAVLSAQVGPDLAARACSNLQQDGATATPLWISWGEVERRDGSRNWSELDDDIRKLRNCGVSIALHLQSQRPWMRTDTPPNAVEFARFASELAARYRGQIARYSIENEANAQVMWPYDPSLYFELLRVVRPAIKNADPAALVQHSGVSSGGLGWARTADLHAAGRRAEAVRAANDVLVNGTGSGPAMQVTDAQLDALVASPDVQRQAAWVRLELQHQDLTDAFQVHSYGDANRLAELMRWLRAAGIKKPFEVWELAKRYGHQPYSDTTHAAEVAKLMVTAVGEGSRYTIFVRYLDWPDKHLPGLVGVSGESLPARRPFRTVVAALTGATAASPLPESVVGARGYHFSTPRGRVAALWTDQGTATVRLPVDATSVRVLDVAGGVRTADPRAITVGTSPVLVEIGR